MEQVLQITAAGAGSLLVLGVLLSAMRTVVLPRGVPVRLTSMVFGGVRMVFAVLVRSQSTFAARDRLMGHYAPVALLLLPFVWLTLALIGFAGIFMLVEDVAFEQAIILSGSALITLGFERPETLAGILLSFVEGAVAISVLALLLVTYLPSMYAAFSEREAEVSLFEVSGGNPPSAVEMMIRYHAISGLETTERVWRDWERWFARIAESHVALPALVYFRSPDPQMSWVTAAGAVLDAAAMMTTVIDLGAAGVRDLDTTRPDGQHIHMPSAETCLRAGYVSLRRIGDQHGLVYEREPAQTDPISVTRAEFDTACAEMADAGVPLRADLDDAWIHWAGWRVNYDAVLIQLADLTVAPPSRWVSDLHETDPRRVGEVQR